MSARPDDDATPPLGLPAALLTVPEVARLLRVSNMTVYRLCHEGRLESVRIGDRVMRVSRAAVKRLMGATWPGE